MKASKSGAIFAVEQLNSFALESAGFYNSQHWILLSSH